jgi:hypothetical protein
VPFVAAFKRIIVSASTNNLPAAKTMKTRRYTLSYTTKHLYHLESPPPITMIRMGLVCDLFEHSQAQEDHHLWQYSPTTNLDLPMQKMKSN